MQDAEYEIQNFGFSVEQLKLERRHIIKSNLSSILDGFFKSSVEKSNLSQEAFSKLLDIQKDVLEKMVASFQNTLDSIEKLDEQNFSIPPNVLLHMDLKHAKGYTKDDEERLQNEVESLKKQFLENSVMISAIETENTKYLDIQNVVQEEMEVFHAVQETFTAINVQKMRKVADNVRQTLNKSKPDSET